MAARDYLAAANVAGEAVAIADRHREVELAAFARNFQGRALLQAGRVDAGIALLDEAMLAASRDELGPLITGLVYCSVIAGCNQVYALDRAREWTAALASFCDAQAELVLFAGNCSVHRAEVLQLGGAWPEAIEVAERVAGQD